METQIVDLEKKYWQGMESHNYETVKSLTRFPCIVAGKTGVMNVDEPTFKKMFESGDGARIKVVGISNVQTQLLGDNAAVNAYIIELDVIDDSNPPTKCACTSTWVNENGSWLCAMHTETELVER